MATTTRGLGKVRQDDFSAGAFQGVARHLIPPTGLYGAQNALFDEDAACYKRGGSEWLTPPAVGTSLRWVWDGILGAGARTVAANTADYLVVNAAGTAFVNLSGSGMTAPLRATVFDGILVLDDGFMYGGSYKASSFAGTNAIAVTNQSAVVTVASGGLTANVDPGMLLRVDTGGRYYVVLTVDSDTQATLTAPYQGSTDGTADFVFEPRGSASNAPYLIGSGYATIFNRLLMMSGNQLRFTGGRQANGDVLHTFGADDTHDFSGQLLGVQPIRDLVFVFTTDGMFVISGMASDLLDPDGVNFQQQVEPVNSDLILWGKEGLATYQNQMLVPGVDGLWTMGASASPVQLSKSIQRRWRDHVHSGNKPGLATVFRNHYFVPVLDTGNAVVDHLVCRLDRPQDSHIGTVFPWSWWDGHAADTVALATRISGTASRSPKLLAASHSTGRIMDLTSAFDPADANASEADGADIEWQVELRDYATGSGNLNHARRLKIRYELVTPTGAVLQPVIVALLGLAGSDPDAALYDEAVYDTDVYAEEFAGEYTSLAGGAPPDSGRNPYTWHFNKRARYVRALLHSSIPSSRLILRSVEWYIRPAGDDR